MQPRLILDTANIEQIAKAIQTGVVGGIATNPSKVAAAGKPVETVVREIRAIFDGPIAVEAPSTQALDIVREARQLSGLSANIAIKIATTFEGVKAVSLLAKEGIKTNATLIFTPSQALAAALAGATYISPFVGRARDVGLDPMETLSRIREVYDAFGLTTVVIAASIRSTDDVIDSILAGADMVAVRPEIFEQMFRHPLTDEGVEKFLQASRSQA